MNNPSSPNGFIAPEPSELAPLFPGYEIHDLIATGGMGAVYRATQRSLDRTVALKILPLEFSEDAEFCAGFEAEAKAMARLNHPNLIGVHDFGEVNGMLFIVMEFVPGKSIHHSAYGQAIDPRDVIRLVTGVCNGLAHAHENGILHRDIKPSNILLTPQAEPKIGDFGLARPVERKTQEGEVIFGTPGYTAPEVVNAPETVDHRADLFSVGVLLHELLTGKLPADDLRPPSLISGCDVRFDTITQRATSSIPANRYSSATEIAGDLQKLTAAPATAPLAIVRGTPGRGPARPSMSQRASNAGVKRKSMNLTWVGPLVAIAIMGYSWHVFANMKSRVVIIDDPASKSSSSGSPRNGADSGNVPNDSQALRGSALSQLPTTPPSSDAHDVAIPEVLPAMEVKKPVAIVYDATDLTTFRNKMKQHVTAKGRVLKVGVNKPGTIRYLNFTEPFHNSLSVMMLVSDSPDEFTELKLMTYVGKSIQLSGIIEENQGALQLQIRSLAELKILDGEQSIVIDPSASSSAKGTRKTPPEVPGGAKYFSGKWYSVNEEICSWTTARDKCKSMGGQLAVIPNASTQKFLAGLAPEKNLWLGGSDEANEGTWVWVDGSKFGFTRFSPGEPQGGARENYLVLSGIHQGNWDDYPNSELTRERWKVGGYICEWPDKPVASAAATDLSSESAELALWKTKALKEFPTLNDSNSELTRKVKSLRDTKERSTSNYFKNPQWPYLLAKEADGLLTKKPDSQHPVFLDDLTEIDLKIGFGHLGKHGGGPGNSAALIKGIKPEHSLLPHPPANGSSFVTYSLNGKFSVFTGTSTLADIAKPHPFRFRIKGDGKILWRSKIIQNGKDAEEFSISVKGINKLELEIECPENAGTAWAMWLSPRLLE